MCLMNVPFTPDQSKFCSFQPLGQGQWHHDRLSDSSPNWKENVKCHVRQDARHLLHTYFRLVKEVLAFKALPNAIAPRSPILFELSLKGASGKQVQIQVQTEALDKSHTYISVANGVSDSSAVAIQIAPVSPILVKRRLRKDILNFRIYQKNKTILKQQTFCKHNMLTSTRLSRRENHRTI